MEVKSCLSYLISSKPPFIMESASSYDTIVISIATCQVPVDKITCLSFRNITLWIAGWTTVSAVIKLMRHPATMKILYK